MFDPGEDIAQMPGSFRGADSCGGGGGFDLDASGQNGGGAEGGDGGGDVSFIDLSTLEMELGGHLSGVEYDTLSIDGTATLDGTLQLSYWNGFVANPGDSFQILTAGTRMGTFDQVIFPDAQNWSLTYGTDFVTINIVPEPDTTVLALGGLMFVLIASRRRRHICALRAWGRTRQQPTGRR